MEVNLQEFPNSALKVGEWSVSLFVRFTYRERAADTHRLEDLVGHRIAVGAVGKKEMLVLAMNRKIRTQSPY
jgi:hypothetical protein